MRKLRWSTLLNLTELEWIPAAPTELQVADEIVHSIAWLTGATNQDRRLLRCDLNGALLVGHPWSLLHVVEAHELHPDTDVPDATPPCAYNKGVLVATSDQLITAGFVRVSGGASETVYIPPGELFWYPFPTYSVTATVVPATGGTASYVGVTVFK